ncbi:hypothetical protein BpHYR1_050707, partial [Brachionus plicatilis]
HNLDFSNKNLKESIKDQLLKKKYSQLNFDHLIMIMNFKLPTKATQKKSGRKLGSRNKLTDLLASHENSEIRRILVYFRTDSQGPTKILTRTYLTNQKYF